jgi:hypothetical protein
VIDPWHFRVSGNVDQQLVRHIALPEAATGHFGFDNDLLFRQQKVGSRSAPGIARSPFLRTDVLEMQFQNRMEQILDIVFVPDDIRFPLSLPRLQPFDEQREPAAERDDSAQWIAVETWRARGSGYDAIKGKIECGGLGGIVHRYTVRDYQRCNRLFGGGQLNERRAREKMF